MRSLFGVKDRLLGSKGKLLVLITIGLIAITQCALGAATFVSGLAPDWNQPYRYGPPPNGPTDPAPGVPGAATQWNAWCAPSSAANLAGHWADVRGVPVADTNAFPVSSVLWPAGPSWHDYQADGFARPQPQVAPAALPVPATDIGWYMDSNRGTLYDPPGVGTMGGYFFGNLGLHTGTYLKDIQPGLQNYLNSRYSLSGSIYWRTGTRGVGFASGVDPSGFPAVIHPNEASAFAEVKSEIDSNRTLILCFRYWNPAKTVNGVPQTGTNTESALSRTNYVWGTTPQPPYTNAEDEAWNFYDNGMALGHAVTCVGYIPAYDPEDKGPALGLGPTDWVIVHDNWSSTMRNVIIPYGSPLPLPGGTFNAAWVANTTAVPWPTNAKFVKGLVPDWNQPYQYPPQFGSNNGGPGGDPQAGVVNQWNAWCAPTSAANLAGHWTDYHGAPVADTTPFDSSTVMWATGPSWQDYLADAVPPLSPPTRPAPQFVPGPLPASPTDIGWYMDTDFMVPYDDGSPNVMGGFFLPDPPNPRNGPHTGTYVKDIHIGLAIYLNSLYSGVLTNNASGWWNTGTEGKFFAAGLNPTGGVAQIQANEPSAFGEVMFEINRNHTLILSFNHWNIAPTVIPDIPSGGTNTECALGGSYYDWSYTPSPGSPNAEDENWNFEYGGDNLGHAVTAVGYIPANDLLDPGVSLGKGPTDWVIVHDNWASTPRNVIIPFDYLNNWVANTIAYPDAGFLRITKIELAAGTNAVIGLAGIPGALHHLQWQSDMTNNTWSTCVSNMAFRAGTMQMTNTVSSSEQKRFYRVKASY